MTISEIMQIMGEGVMFGGLFTIAPVGIGYAVKLFYRIMNKAS